MHALFPQAAQSAPNGGAICFPALAAATHATSATEAAQAATAAAADSPAPSSPLRATLPASRLQAALESNPSAGFALAWALWLPVPNAPSQEEEEEEEEGEGEGEEEGDNDEEEPSSSTSANSEAAVATAAAVVSLLHEADPSAGFLASSSLSSSLSSSSSSSRLLGRGEWACLLRWARALQGAKWQKLMLALAPGSSRGGGGGGGIIHQSEQPLGQLAASVDQWADEFHVLSDVDSAARGALADVCGALRNSGNSGTGNHGNSSSSIGSSSGASEGVVSFPTMRAIRNHLRSHLDPRRKFFHLLDVQTCFGFGPLPALPSSATIASSASGGGSASSSPFNPSGAAHAFQGMRAVVGGEGDGDDDDNGSSSSSHSQAGTCELVVGVLQLAYRGHGKPQLLVEPWSAFPPVLVVAQSSLVCAATINGLDVLERSLMPENEDDDGDEFEEGEEDEEKAGGDGDGDGDSQRLLVRRHSAATR